MIVDPYYEMIDAERPLFSVIDYINPRTGARNSHRPGISPEMRCLGILRQDGTYEAVTARDYVSWIRPMSPRKYFPTGLACDQRIMEALVPRLNELFAKDKFPPVTAMRQVWRQVWRDALDEIGFTRKTPTGEWFGEPKEEL